MLTRTLRGEQEFTRLLRDLLGAGPTGSSKATGFYLAAESCCWEGARRIASVDRTATDESINQLSGGTSAPRTTCPGGQFKGGHPVL